MTVISPDSRLEKSVPWFLSFSVPLLKGRRRKKLSFKKDSCSESGDSESDRLVINLNDAEEKPSVIKELKVDLGRSLVPSDGQLSHSNGAPNKVNTAQFVQYQHQSQWLHHVCYGVLIGRKLTRFCDLLITSQARTMRRNSFTIFFLLCGNFIGRLSVCPRLGSRKVRVRMAWLSTLLCHNPFGIFGLSL